MGLKKKFLRRAVGTMVDAATRRNGVGRLAKKTKSIKKIFLTMAVLGLIFIIGSVALLSYTVSKVSNMVTANPDADLAAMEYLLKDKTIVLTEEQKTRLVPIIRELAKAEQIPEQAKALKEKLWAVLEPAQVKAVKAWKDKTAKEAGALVETGKASATDIIGKYTGISQERVKQTIDGLSGWWQLNGPQKGSTEKLLQEVEGN